jgi:hypothetical protein
MVAPLKMHASGFLTTLSQAPKVFILRGVPGVHELTCPGPHDLHRTTVPRDFLSSDPPHRGPAKGGALFWVWCTHELGPNSYRNLDRDV